MPLTADVVNVLALVALEVTLRHVFCLVVDTQLRHSNSDGGSIRLISGTLSISGQIGKVQACTCGGRQLQLRKQL